MSNEIIYEAVIKLQWLIGLCILMNIINILLLYLRNHNQLIKVENLLKIIELHSNITDAKKTATTNVLIDIKEQTKIADIAAKEAVATFLQAKEVVEKLKESDPKT